MIGCGQVRIKKYSTEKLLTLSNCFVRKKRLFIELAIWLLPTQWKYGGWPLSGEIDLVEARGNEKYGNDEQIGVEQVVSTLHFGPRWDQDAYRTSGFSTNNSTGFHNDFHKYGFIWDESGIKYLIDGTELGFIPVGEGFWKRGGFSGDNIWASATNMAPFDQEVNNLTQTKFQFCHLKRSHFFLQFHFIINLAVGGNFFPDVNNQNGKRPWNGQQTAMKEFWTNRAQWLRSWRNRESSSLLVDSVKVWAI